MGRAHNWDESVRDAVEILNADGRGGLVIVCDHASNIVPADYGTLGLDPSELERHIAWDPGARPVSAAISALLDAPLVASRISRLIIDCNRPLDAPDLIPAISETTRIPGNENLGADERGRRIALAHAPFHQAIEEVLDARARAGLESWLVSIHSFTPVYEGVLRPWDIGIVHGEDDRLACSLIEALRRLPALVVGVNEPYSPADRVYHTITTHALSRRLPCAMIEIRNDRIADCAGQNRWAGLLAGVLALMRPAVPAPMDTKQ